MTTTHNLDDSQVQKNRYVSELGLLDVPQHFKLSVPKIVFIAFHSQPHLPLEFSFLTNGTSILLRSQSEGVLARAISLSDPAFIAAVTLWGDVLVDSGSFAAPDFSPIAGKWVL